MKRMVMAKGDGGRGGLFVSVCVSVAHVQGVCEVFFGLEDINKLRLKYVGRLMLL